MIKRTSLHRESKPKLVQSFLPIAKRLHAMARSPSGERWVEESRLSQSLANTNRAQLSKLMISKSVTPSSGYDVLSLQPFFGNQAAQSLMSQGVASLEPEARGCSCGGRCAKCAHSLLPDGRLDEEEFPPQSAPLNSKLGQIEPLRLGEVDEGPHQGSGTIVCDGKGDYRVDLGWGATAGCGVKDCVQRHEESHMADWRVRWPDGCKNADTTPMPDGTAVPTGGDGYGEFLRKSECKAYTTELECESALLKTTPKECKVIGTTTLQDTVNDRQAQAKKYCSSGC